MPIDDYPGDVPDAPAKGPGKYIKISVPDFMNTGNASAMGSYLRLGAVEDATTAGKPPAKAAKGAAQPTVGLVAGVTGSASAPLVPVPPDPTGEDLASLVQGFADDTRNRGTAGLPPGGQGTLSATTLEGPPAGYPEGLTTADPTRVPNLVEGGVPQTPGSPAPSDFDPTDYRAIESSLLHTKGGWRDHSDGNRITTTRGDKVEVIRGNYKLVVLGRQDQSKQKFQGSDISGGSTDTGDLTADASTDQSPYTTAFSTLSEWKMVPPDTEYRSYTTTKKGAAPKVATKDAVASPGVPAVTADGKTFSQPIAGSVGINETWSYVTYNYSGIAYAKAPRMDPPAAAGGAWTAEQPAPDLDPALVPDLDYVVYPSAKVVNKTYAWDQTTETYVNSTWTLTAGPRVTDAAGNPTFPAATTSPGPPYDPLVPVAIPGSGYTDSSGNMVLPPVTAPGTQLGNYNKVASITTETHVHQQSTYTVADDTYAESHVSGTASTNTTVGHQKSVLNATTTSSESNILGGTSSISSVVGGTSSISSVVGGTSSISNVLGGTSDIKVIEGVTSSIGITAGAAFALKATLADISVTLAAIAVAIKMNPAVNVDIKFGTTHVNVTIPQSTDLKLTNQEIHALQTALHGSTVTVNGPSGAVQLAPLHVIT